MSTKDRWVPWRQQRQQEPYEALVSKSEDDDISNSETLTNYSHPRQKSIVWRRCFEVFPWLLCMLLATSLALVLSERMVQHPYGTYESGFDTDMKAAPKPGLQKVKFWGGIQVDPNGTYYITHNPDEPRYVGPPSPEIDDAWQRHILRRYVGLSPEEAAEGGFDVKEQDWILDRYWVAPNALHTLHCLNFLRKSLDPDYYTDTQELPAQPFRMSRRLHAEHCIEAIRQSLQCSMDMSPVPRPYIPQAGIYHADIDQWHTCRDYSAVSDWVNWRNRDIRAEDFTNSTLKWADKNAPYAKWNPWWKEGKEALAKSAKEGAKEA